MSHGHTLYMTMFHIFSLITSEVSRMKVFHFFNWFWYASDMICCYELFLAWFCSYDVDTVSETILIWFQLWFLMWVKIVVWSQPIGTTFKTVSKPYQDRIKIVSKPYQDHIKIISKPQKPSRNRPKGCPGAVSASFLEANPSGTLIRRSVLKPYQNHIKITSKTFQNHNPNHNPNHIKNITKPYRNHIFQSYQTILKSLKQ